MTSLVHPRRLLRRSRSANPASPRDPRGGGFGCRISPWDAMGYHGITWASTNSRTRLPRPGRPDIHGSLTGYSLKEWLRVRPRPRVGPAASRVRLLAGFEPLWASPAVSAAAAITRSRDAGHSLRKSRGRSLRWRRAGFCRLRLCVRARRTGQGHFAECAASSKYRERRPRWRVIRAGKVPLLESTNSVLEATNAQDSPDVRGRKRADGFGRARAGEPTGEKRSRRQQPEIRSGARRGQARILEVQGHQRARSRQCEGRRRD